MIAGSRLMTNEAPQTAATRADRGFSKVPAKGGGNFRKIFVWFLDEIKFQVPVGYEDAGGFHFGAEPAMKQDDAIPVINSPVEAQVESCACGSDELCCLT